MVASASSAPFALVLATSLCLGALGLRSRGGSGANPHAHGSCPPVVLWQGKGQCIDGQTGTEVQVGCCQEIQACRRDIASATEATIARIATYQLRCGVDVADKALNREKLCMAECRAAVAELGPPVDAQAIMERCRKIDNDRGMQTLEVVAPLLLGVEAALRECKADKEAAAVAPSEQRTCADPSMRHHDCGFFGIDQQGCEARGCCWDPSRDGTHWCYDTSAASRCTRMCPKYEFPREGRSDCRGFNSTHPDEKVRGAACEAAGCCWQPLEHHSDDAWCFHQPCLL